jgi:hypothetical protein
MDIILINVSIFILAIFVSLSVYKNEKDRYYCSDLIGKLMITMCSLFIIFINILSYRCDLGNIYLLLLYYLLLGFTYSMLIFHILVYK